MRLEVGNMDKNIVQFNLEGKHIGNNTVENNLEGYNEQYYVSSDSNKYLSPMHYLIVAVSGCTQLVLDSVAKEIGMRIDSLETKINCEMDTRGAKGETNKKTYPQYMHQLIEIKTSDQEKLEDLVNEFEKRCPMYNLIKDTDLNYIVEYKLL
jgi:uncharacterized OsmC-like protein